MAMDLSQSRACRIARARELFEAGAFLVTAGAVLVLTDRADVVGGGYTVERGACPCKDAEFTARRLGLNCAHQQVAEWVELLADQAADRAAMADIRASLPSGVVWGAGEEESMFKPERPRRLAPTPEAQQLERWDAERRLAILAQENAL